MALDVQCGCASKIEIVRTNSLTGEVTGFFEFDNIWTDAGLARISGAATAGGGAPWPSQLHYGSGAHVAPHNGVTRLANRIGDAAWVGSSNATYPDLDTVLVTRTASATVAARGVAWELSELGLGVSSGASNLDTYSLTKIGGVPAPIPVAAIEILTITYTVQIQYPRRLPPQLMSFENGPETWGTFTIPGTEKKFAGSYIRGYSSNSYYHPRTNIDYPSRYSGAWAVFDDIKAVGENTSLYASTTSDNAYWTVTFDPPITKTNTEELSLSVLWTFTNGTYREV